MIEPRADAREQQHLATRAGIPLTKVKSPAKNTEVPCDTMALLERACSTH